MSSTIPHRRHALLRGGRWHLARSNSRALWTSASPTEISDLLVTLPLRRQLEQFLQFAAEAIPEVERLLVFDDECVDLLVSVSLISVAAYHWDWMTQTWARPAVSPSRGSAGPRDR